jgi:hypothetical protein
VRYIVRYIRLLCEVYIVRYIVRYVRLLSVASIYFPNSLLGETV